MNIYPYVYRLDHPITGEFYIGFRSANKVPAEQDLGHKYFTSSKLVKPKFHEFTYRVVAEFFDGVSAYEFEQQLIHESWGDNKMLNKSCNYESKRQWSRVGLRNTDDHNRKVSESITGRKRSHDFSQKISAAHKGKAWSESRRKNRTGTLNGNSKTWVLKNPNGETLTGCLADLARQHDMTYMKFHNLVHAKKKGWTIISST